MEVNPTGLKLFAISTDILARFENNVSPALVITGGL
jgi:hypothetical protein